MPDSIESTVSIEALAERVTQLERRADRANEVEAAKALLSGTLPRQRIHWSQEILHLDRLTVLATIAIWTLFLRDEAGAREVALAGGLSSLLIGLWRLYARYIDGAIARLYAPIAHSEEILGVGELDSVLLNLRRRFTSVNELRQAVENRVIGDRGHLVFDWLAIGAIVAMGVLAWVAAEGISCCDFGAPVHPIGGLLFLNGIGLLPVLIGMNAYQTRKGRVRRLLQAARESLRGRTV